MTTTKKTQCQRLLAYLKKNRKGITTMDAFRELGITCVHKRVSELENGVWEMKPHGYRHLVYHGITRTPERTASGSTVTRYKLAR